MNHNSLRDSRHGAVFPDLGYQIDMYNNVHVRPTVRFDHSDIAIVGQLLRERFAVQEEDRTARWAASTEPVGRTAWFRLH